ncbi:3TM-type holin [Sedimenticola hydrogenitrophicus]|uniref:3TM-type holin n=1 Tax=Sedimenticola hydrogenitrophicus TaxID=2967975 RepID=UPI0023AEE437|nr:3TM-type holin [Sedimenticola hydrogenitrophicus]
MDWSDISGAIAKAAPLVSTLLLGPAGAGVGALVASALGTEANPAAVATALQDPASLERIRQMELDNKADLTRMHLEAETARLAEVNQTMRAEAASIDPYVRRWRPTYGYLTALAWFVQMTGFTFILGLVAYQHPADLAAVVGALGSVLAALLGLWGIALAVLGVNVTSRSKDKQVHAGQEPAPGLMAALAKRLAG